MRCAKTVVIFVTEGDFAAFLNPSFNWKQIRTDPLNVIDAGSMGQLHHCNLWEKDHLKDIQTSLIWKPKVWHK